MPTIRHALLRHFLGDFSYGSAGMRHVLLLVTRARAHASDNWADMYEAVTFVRRGPRSTFSIAAETAQEFEEMCDIVKMFIGPFAFGYQIIVYTHGLNWSTLRSGQLSPEDSAFS